VQRASCHSGVVFVQIVVAVISWKLRKVLFKLKLVGLVEKFGRFNRLLKPGFNLINPCSEEVFDGLFFVGDDA
jgi:regulator of protease activity HflC (stomatin/prohibitin superfamily)